MVATRLPALLAVFLMQAVTEKPLLPLLDFASWQAANNGVTGGRE